MASTPRKGKIQRANRLILSRTLILLIVCGVVAFMVLAIKLFQIQIVQHDEYESLAINQQVRETTITASRGTIYDRNGEVLAMSASVESVYVSPVEIATYEEDAQLIATRLAEILDVDADWVYQKTQNQGSWYETIKRQVEKETADEVRAFINEYDLVGVKLEEDTKRYYPNGSLAAHVIGFVGTDNYGLAGLEYQYESYLKGVNGRVVRLTNASGTDMLFTQYEDYYDAQDGNNVITTIDATIQYYLEKHLEQAVADYDVLDGAAAIAMNPNTGEILGMVSLQNYDPNSYQTLNETVQERLNQIQNEEEYDAAYDEALADQWRNRAISDTYEPGSVFKIITMAIALEEGLISENDVFYCGGSIAVLGRGSNNPVHCWRTWGHGSQTLKEAAQNSCNVAFVNIGLRIGAETFYEYVEAFGFFDETNIDLPGEGTSLWWSDEVFMDETNLSQLASASFGQTFNITPIQMITAVSAVANGGYLMEPYVVKQITDEDGNVVLNNEPTVVRQVISEETSDLVCEILETVVSEGTGKNAYVAGYRIAGKTGTSEKVAQVADGGEEEYIVSFMGFAPANDPQVVVLVLLDNPSKDSGIYISGGQMAAPVVGNIMADILPYLGVEPQYTEEEEANIDKTVPGVVGNSLDQARSDLEAQGFTVNVVGSGTEVTYQLPSANALVSSGTTVTLYTDDQRPADTVTVPNLYGMTVSQARQTLESMGLYLRTSGAQATESGVVVSMQSVDAGTEVETGTVLQLTLTDQSNLGMY